MKLFELDLSGVKTKKQHPKEAVLTKGSATEIANWLKSSHDDLKSASQTLSQHVKKVGKDISDSHKAKLAHAKALLHAKFREAAEDKKEVKESTVSAAVKLPDIIYQAALGKDPKKWTAWYTGNGYSVDKKTNRLVKDGQSWKIDSGSKSLVIVKESVSDETSKIIALLTITYSAVTDNDSIPSSDLVMIKKSIADYLEKGWTQDEIVAHMRNMEEVNPDIDEDVALRKMKAVKDKVEARLAAQ